MGISGFDIISEAVGSAVAAEVEWFTITNNGNYDNVGNDNGNAKFKTDAPHGMKAGDLVDVAGSFYSFTAELIISVDSPTTFTVKVPFVDDETGTWAQNPAIPFPDTPENLLREIHVQFDTSASVVIEISLNAGVDYMKLNNGNSLIGLATFTFFVVKNTKLNFRTESGAVATDFAIVVTGT